MTAAALPAVAWFYGTGPEWRGGWRLVVPLAAGRQWLLLFDAATLATYRVPAGEERRLKPEPTARPRWLARAIRDRERGLRARDRRYSARAVRAALSRLEAPR